MLFRVLLAGIVGWIIWRWLTKLLRSAIQKQAMPSPPPPQPGAKTSAQVQELLACPACGLWRTRENQSHCDRADCPF